MLSMLGIYAATAMTATESVFDDSKSSTNDGRYGHGIPNNPSIIIPAGCKEFNIGGIKVIALNRKNAQKKAEKLHKSRIASENC